MKAFRSCKKPSRVPIQTASSPSSLKSQVACDNNPSRPSWVLAIAMSFDHIKFTMGLFNRGDKAVKTPTYSTDGVRAIDGACAGPCRHCSHLVVRFSISSLKISPSIINNHHHPSPLIYHLSPLNHSPGQGYSRRVDPAGSRAHPSDGPSPVQLRADCEAQLGGVHLCPPRSLRSEPRCCAQEELGGPQVDRVRAGDRDQDVHHGRHRGTAIGGRDMHAHLCGEQA